MYIITLYFVLLVTEQYFYTWKGYKYIILQSFVFMVHSMLNTDHISTLWCCGKFL